MFSAMTSVLLAALLVAISYVSATHFRGATMNWQPLNTSTVISGDMSLPVRISFKIAWGRNTAEGKCDSSTVAEQREIGQDVKWKCLTENCGTGHTPKPHAVGSMKFICTAFSDEGVWVQGSNSFIFNFPVNDTKTFFRVGIDPLGVHECCWIQNAKNFPSDMMRLHTELDFSPRPDNGKLNRSPVTDMIPILPTRSGCEHHLYIPHSDPDFDNLRCRWATTHGSVGDRQNTLNECGSICFHQLNVHYGAILINDTCEIIWTPPEPGLYGVAVQIEDFAPGFPDKPLSETPLQFLIQVSHSNLTCDQKPVFQDTPLQPNCFAVSEGDTFTFDIYATHVAYPIRTAKFLTLTRPRGMSEPAFLPVIGKPGIKKASLRWTPDEEQYGHEHLFCFIVVDEDGVASDQQCISILVGFKAPKIAVDSVTGQALVTFDVEQMQGTISYDRPIRKPTAARYIEVFESDTNQLVEKIDTSASTNVEISADFFTATISLKGSYKPATTHHIIVQEGAFVGHDNCAGGGPNAEGIDSNMTWVFSTDAVRCKRQTSVAERVHRSVFVLTGTVKKCLIYNPSPSHYGVTVSVHWVYKGLFPSNMTLPATVFISGFTTQGNCSVDVEIGDTLVFFTSINRSNHMLVVRCFDVSGDLLSSVAPVTYKVLKEVEDTVKDLQAACGSSHYGCCSDSVTAAAGNRSEGCPDYSFVTMDQFPSSRTIQISEYPVDIMSGLDAYDLLAELPLSDNYRCDKLNKVSFKRASHHINLTKPIEKVLDCLKAFPEEYSILVQSMQPEGLTSYLLALDQTPDIHPFAIRFQDSSVVFEYREIGSRVKKHVEFDVDLTDGQFYRYAFGVTNSSVSLYVNCSLAEEKPITGLDPVEFKGDFVVGRKHVGTDTFTGIIEKLLLSPNPAHAAQQCLLYDFYECRPSFSLDPMHTNVLDC